MKSIKRSDYVVSTSSEQETDGANDLGDATKLFGIIHDISRGQNSRYVDIHKGEISYFWLNVLEDFASVCKENPCCVLDQRASDGSTIFHVVAENSGLLDGSILEYLIGIDRRGLEIQNRLGLLPIHRAVMHSDTDVEELELLLKHYPEGLLVQNIEGQTPLHLAVTGTKASQDAVTFILSECPDSSRIVDKYGHLPLHKAVSRNSCNIIIISDLIDAFEEGVQCPDRTGCLPLHWALARAAPSVILIKLLVKSYPQSTKIADKKGLLPIDKFRQHGEKTLLKDRQVIFYILTHTEEFVAAERKREADLEEAEFLIEDAVADRLRLAEV